MKSKSPRKRLDRVLVERGLADSPQKAQAMILAGEVRVNNVAVQKAGTPISSDARIEVKSRQLKYASRGGLKLEGALEDFSIDPAGLVCLDAARPPAASRIACCEREQRESMPRRKHRPTRLEAPARSARDAIERNARELKSADLPEQVDLVVADVSFISVCKILARVLLARNSTRIFSSSSNPNSNSAAKTSATGGIVTDVRLHEKAIASVRKCAEVAGLSTA